MSEDFLVSEFFLLNRSSELYSESTLTLRMQFGVTVGH